VRKLPEDIPGLSLLGSIPATRLRQIWLLL
jgi:hypothetical protein